MINKALKKSTKAYWAVTIFILLSGFIAEVIMEDKHFQRSGSLVVVFAFLLFFHNLKYRDEEARVLRTNQQADTWEFVLSMFEKVNSPKDLAAYNEGPRAKLNQAVETLRITAELTKSEIRKIETTERWIAVLGTIVWGYGDILARKILGFCSM